MIYRAPMTRKEMKRAGFIHDDNLRKDAFWKGLKIIESCENNIHIEGAENYIDNFQLAFEDTFKNGIQLDALLVALKEKKLKLKL
tara:strand:- start:689 stop:943 length:255 start_codon:yes stop_codon:yes gene_type:complete